MARDKTVRSSLLVIRTPKARFHLVRFRQLSIMQDKGAIRRGFVVEQLLCVPSREESRFFPEYKISSLFLSTFNEFSLCNNCKPEKKIIQLARAEKSSVVGCLTMRSRFCNLIRRTGAYTARCLEN